MAKMDAYEKGHGPGQPAPDKFQYKPGDIEWTKPPKGAVKAPRAAATPPGKQRVNATVKGLSSGQRNDLATRLRAKLGKRRKGGKA
jgi:hypothetical protein